MYVVAGSYEGHLIGYQLSAASLQPLVDADQARALTPAFALKAHDGCVRAVATGGVMMATCGSDHTIAVYNLRKLREHGKLLQQGGGSALECLAFYGASHLVSGGGDGELCIWRSSDWECLLRMKGHKGAVHAIAIHPSGRAALTVAADSKLMLWNLTTGKCNYTSALAEASRLVAWSLDGEAYVYASRHVLLMYNLRSGELMHSFTHDQSVPLCVAFVTNQLAVSGDEAGTLRVWDLSGGRCVHKEVAAHGRRVKAIAVLPQEAEEDAEANATPALTTASSDGTITVWRLNVANNSNLLVRLLTIRTQLRITSLTASAPAAAVAEVKVGAERDCSDRMSNVHAETTGRDCSTFEEQGSDALQSKGSNKLKRKRKDT